jgi:hypothetical protein
MKCNFCEEQLEEIKFGHIAVSDTEAHINNEKIILFVCTSRDCKNCGVVIAVPATPKED